MSSPAMNVADTVIKQQLSSLVFVKQTCEQRIQRLQDGLDETDFQLPAVSAFRLVSNIRRTSNIRCIPTLGNSQLEFSQTIRLAKTSNTRRTPSFDSWVSIVDKVWSRTTWSELLRVAWDFDSPWITGPMTAHQSVAYVGHIILTPAANLCTLSAIVFLPIKACIWLHLRRYIDSSAILLTFKGPVWPRWLKISPCVRMKIMWNETTFQKNHISLWQIVHIKLYIPSIASVATNFCYDFTIVLPVDCASISVCDMYSPPAGLGPEVSGGPETLSTAVWCRTQQ